MKVIFLKDASGGSAGWRKGQVKDVSDGYAQNFLIPKGFAALATSQILAKVEKEGKEAQNKKLKEIEKLNLLKHEIEKRTFTLKVKVGEKGQVFGGVHEKDIAKAISDKMYIEIGKTQVEFIGSIKELGEHQARVKLSNGIKANIKIKIEAEK